MPKEIVFMGVPLNVTDKSEVLSAIHDAKIPVRIATVNPEFILEAIGNERFKDALRRMTHCTIDGSGVSFALRFLNLFKHHDIPVQIYHGADMAEDLFNRYANGEKRFFFLGGKPGAAELASDVIRTRYPNIQIVGCEDGGHIDPEAITLDNDLVSRLSETRPDILLVAFGAPKQELWINKARDVTVPVMIGVGGTLDFYSQKQRAPQWMRNLSLEWLYRTVTEPGHFRRTIQAVVIFPVLFLFAFCSGRALR